MMQTHYPVHCRPVSHGDKGKWRQVLWSAVCVCVWCISFACRIFFHRHLASASFPFLSFPLPSFLSSRPWCRTLQPPPRGPLGATLGSVCCWFTRFFGTGSSWRRQNKSDLKELGREQKAAAAVGVESGFYRHKSLLWWGILSNGNLFSTGGVIAFSLWTPLDSYTPFAPVHFCKTQACTQAIGSLGWGVFCNSALCIYHIWQRWQDMLSSWMHGLWLCQVSKHLRSQNPETN